jgi:hypothetical protein
MRSSWIPVSATVLAVALSAIGTPSIAQTSAPKPTCAAGDAVVWENTRSKVYHLEGDKYYGTTKHGQYACRSAADTAGYHAAGTKASATSHTTSAPTSPDPKAS